MEENITPDIIKVLAERIKEELIPTVELKIKDGKLHVIKKDRGLRIIIHDYDESETEEPVIDTYNEWELIIE